MGSIDEAEVFYSQLLKMSGERVSAGRHYFNVGGIILACYDPQADGDEDEPQWRPHPNQYIYIAVDDLEKIFETAKSLHPKMIDDSIEKMPWGERLFYMNDPWGNPVCFVDHTTLYLGSN